MQNLSNTVCSVFQMINHISNDSDCGVFAIAFATSLVYTLDRWSVDPNIPRFYNVHVLIQMRTYLALLVCLPESWSHYSFSDG